ncbi:MAG: hypothetical protein WD159_01385, partial [Patescibacteria group bacterium]
GKEGGLKPLHLIVDPNVKLSPRALQGLRKDLSAHLDESSPIIPTDQCPQNNQNQIIHHQEVGEDFRVPAVDQSPPKARVVELRFQQPSHYPKLKLNGLSRQKEAGTSNGGDSPIRNGHVTLLPATALPQSFMAPMSPR